MPFDVAKECYRSPVLEIEARQLDPTLHLAGVLEMGDERGLHVKLSSFRRRPTSNPKGFFQSPNQPRQTRTDLARRWYAVVNFVNK